MNHPHDDGAVAGATRRFRSDWKSSPLATAISVAALALFAVVGLGAGATLLGSSTLWGAAIFGAVAPVALIAMAVSTVKHLGTHEYILGDDGVFLRQPFPFRSRFVSYDEYDCATFGEHVVQLRKNGKVVAVVQNTCGAPKELVASLNRARDAYVARGRRDPQLAMQAVGDDVDTWTAHLYARVEGPQYRQSGVTVDELVEYLEDPTVDPKSRIVAATVVALTGDAVAHQRVRVAATRTANPELRHAFERAAPAEFTSTG